MPINKIVATKRGKAAVAAAVAGMIALSASVLPAREPPAVTLAVAHLIKPWEGLVLKSHWDPYAKIYDICYGETRLDGKPVGPGMTKTKAQCEAILAKRVTTDYYKPITKCVSGFLKAPVSVQASMTSGAYNFGVSAMCKSTAARMVAAKRYLDACLAQTAFNKAGGRVVNGLVKRREMGDKQRIGEAELCVSGLPTEATK